MFKYRVNLYYKFTLNFTSQNIEVLYNEVPDIVKYAPKCPKYIFYQLTIILMTVMKFLSMADEIQKICSLKRASFKIFFISCKTIWWRIVKNWPFSVFKINHKGRNQLNSFEMILSESNLEEQNSVTTSLVSFMFINFYFVTNVLYLYLLSTKLFCVIPKTLLRISFIVKIYSISTATLWNSTTVIKLLANLS